MSRAALFAGVASVVALAAAAGGYQAGKAAGLEHSAVLQMRDLEHAAVLQLRVLSRQQSQVGEALQVAVADMGLSAGALARIEEILNAHVEEIPDGDH